MSEQARNVRLSALARVSARTNRRTLVYVGAGLAIAGAGATAAAGLAAPSPGTVSQGDAASKIVESAPTAGPHRGADEQLDHAATKATDPAKRAGVVVRSSAAGRRAAPSPIRQRETWHMVARVIAAHTEPRPGPGPLPPRDRLTPTGTSGPQAWMAITPARYANAATIVRQAIAKKMGIRSAVIAVATAMQESTLLNINSGTYDSVGLFQQRPSMGWGTVSQIMHPAFAADAFLSALRAYQASNPGWARQPLWQPAQGVQASGFPYAYAKWEAQAAQIVGSVASNMV